MFDAHCVTEFPKCLPTQTKIPQIIQKYCQTIKLMHCCQHESIKTIYILLSVQFPFLQCIAICTNDDESQFNEAFLLLNNEIYSCQIIPRKSPD